MRSAMVAKGSRSTDSTSGDVHSTRMWRSSDAADRSPAIVAARTLMQTSPGYRRLVLLGSPDRPDGPGARDPGRRTWCCSSSVQGAVAACTPPARAGGSLRLAHRGRRRRWSVHPTHGEQLALWLARASCSQRWVAQSPTAASPFLGRPDRASPHRSPCCAASPPGRVRHRARRWQPMVPFGWSRRILVVASRSSDDRRGRPPRRLGRLQRSPRHLRSRRFAGGRALGAANDCSPRRPARLQPRLVGTRARDVRSDACPGRASRCDRRPRPHARRAHRPARSPVVRRRRRRRVHLGGVPRGSGTGDTVHRRRTAAGAEQTWYDEYREDIAWVTDERVALRPFEVYRLLDVRTRHVNIDDGDRVTWTPPPCDCDRPPVWLYGGSAASVSSSATSTPSPPSSPGSPPRTGSPST